MDGWMVGMDGWHSWSSALGHQQGEDGTKQTLLEILLCARQFWGFFLQLDAWQVGAGGFIYSARPQVMCPPCLHGVCQPLVPLAQPQLDVVVTQCPPPSTGPSPGSHHAHAARVPRACCRAVPVTAAQEGPNSPQLSWWGEGASDQWLQQVMEAAGTAGQAPGEGQR